MVVHCLLEVRSAHISLFISWIFVYVLKCLRFALLRCKSEGLPWLSQRCAVWVPSLSSSCAVWVRAWASAHWDNKELAHDEGRWVPKAYSDAEVKRLGREWAMSTGQYFVFIFYLISNVTAFIFSSNLSSLVKPILEPFWLLFLLALLFLADRLA